MPDVAGIPSGRVQKTAGSLHHMFFCSRTDLSGPGGLADGTSDGKGAGISICLHSPDGAGAVLCPSGPDGGRVTGMPGDALSDLGIYQAGADAQGTAVLLCDSDLWNAAFFNRGGICL